MSDSDVYIDDDSDEEFECEEGVVEEDIPEDDSPEGLYQSAKGNLGFMNDLAIKQFVEVMDSEEADDHIRAKACYHALQLLSSTNQIDEMLRVFDIFVKRVEDNSIDQRHFQSTIQEVSTRVLHSEEVMKAYLGVAGDKIDPNKYPAISLDLRLKRIEMDAKFANYVEVERQLQDVECYIPDPPDTNDTTMTRFFARMLVIKIELAMKNGKDEAVDNFYERAISLKNVNMNSRQAAVLKYVEGRHLVKARNFEPARSTLFESFKLYSESGSDKRTEVLAHWVLVTMLLKETTDVFSSPDIAAFQNHPNVAPLRQLHQCYLAHNIVGFKRKVVEAQKVFNSPFYDALLSEVQAQVLMASVGDMCANYTTISLAFIVERTMGEAEHAEYEKMSEAEQKKMVNGRIPEIIDIAVGLILSHKLNASIDRVNGVIVTHAPEPSRFLDTVTPMLDVMEKIAANLLRNTDIDVRSHKEVNALLN